MRIVWIPVSAFAYGRTDIADYQVVWEPSRPLDGLSVAEPFIKKVLADPGMFHPDYDPEIGVEIAGAVWYQGYSDLHDTTGEYEELMEQQ